MNLAGVGLWNVHIDSCLVRVRDAEQFLTRAGPALMRAPTSVRRAVTIPAKGAMIFLKEAVARSLSTLAWAAATVAFFAS